MNASKSSGWAELSKQRTWTAKTTRTSMMIMFFAEAESLGKKNEKS